jgi:intein-encoded DNA endonuclease-like protein
VTPPTTFQLIEKAIGEPLIGYLGALRADERSWPYIARKIAERTGVEVSDESLRRWYVAFAPAGKAAVR